MVPRSSAAARKDVLERPGKEEYVCVMVPRSSAAARKDVPVLLSRVECVKDTERIRWHS